MNLTQQMAKQIRDVHFGDNWTDSSLKEQLSGISWLQAVTQVYSLNTIAALVYHMNYYVAAMLKVLEGQSLDAHDEFSFDHPVMASQSEWDQLLEKTWKDAESMALFVGQLPESKLWEDFSENKYGNYFRNIEGIIEHIHYHLGQIVIIRKIILRQGDHSGSVQKL